MEQRLDLLNTATRTVVGTTATLADGLHTPLVIEDALSHGGHDVAAPLESDASNIAPVADELSPMSARVTDSRLRGIICLPRPNRRSCLNLGMAG